jgi:hypothetical protein
VFLDHCLFFLFYFFVLWITVSNYLFFWYLQTFLSHGNGLSAVSDHVSHGNGLSAVSDHVSHGNGLSAVSDHVSF